MAIEYHLLKRKGKDRRSGKEIQTYHVGYLKPSSSGYIKMKSTGIRVGTKESERQADRLAQQWLQDGIVSISRSSLREYFLDLWNPEKSEYIKSKQAETGRIYSKHYIYNSQLLIEDYFLPYFENLKITTLDQLNHQNLLEWRNALTSGEVKPSVKRKNSSRKESNRLSPASVNKVRQAVWVGLSWAVEMGMLPAHPGTRVKRVSERKQKLASREKRANTILEIVEAKRLFKPELWKSTYSDDYVSYAAALFSFTVGARIGEARGLLFDSVDLETGFCQIIRSYSNDEGLKPPKWERVRKDVPMSDMLIEAIQYIVETYPYANPGPKDFVFPNIKSRNNPTTAAYLSNALKRALKRAEIDKQVRFHDLRHTFVSHAMHDLPSKIVQSIVGHSSSEMTEVVYSHETERDRKELASFVRGLLK
jgi:integrase